MTTDTDKCQQLYTVGYQSTKSEFLRKAVERLNALVFDVRYRPYSRNQTWSKKTFMAAWDDMYFHCADLGNLNYKGHLEGPDVQIVNLDSGCDQVLAALQARPVILMCACYSVSHCHRKFVSDHIESEFGIVSTHLSGKMVKNLASPEKGIQGSLF